MKSGTFSKLRKRGEQDFYLQITSLIDTLVIILVFMLMTIGSGSINLEVAPGVRLPSSINGAEVSQGVKVVAKNDGIYVDSEKIVTLENAITKSADISEKDKKINGLFIKLSKLSEESKAAAKNSNIKFEGRILLQADKSIPLKTIKQILYTAARAGYNDFKFAVLRQ